MKGSILARRLRAVLSPPGRGLYVTQIGGTIGGRDRFAEDAMVTTEQIRELCDKIVHEFHPERVILFGSYAYGTPTEDSDVDLLVVLPYEGRSTAKSAEIRGRVHADYALDLLAYRPDYVRERIEIEDFFLRDVVTHGKVLYEAPNA
jgi:uncharacterized protein